MDPLTHLLTSYTVARAARARMASPEMATVVFAGMAPDMDWLWHLPEPLSPLRAYGTVTHSLAGAAVLAIAIGGSAWLAWRKRPSAASLPWLLAAAFLSTAVHVLLDLCANPGIELYWPFRVARVSWNIASSFDAILIAILSVCALLPVIFGLVTEEIGAHKDPRPPRGWPVTALVLALLYFGVRGTLHARAELLLREAEYGGKSPIHWAAFASGSSPFTWHGVVETETFLEEVEVPVGTGRAFAPESGTLQYKPEPSSVLDAAAATRIAHAYMRLARFPLLTLETTGAGTRAELRELGDSVLRDRHGAWRAVMDLDAQSKVTHEELRYDAARSR